MHFLQPVVIAFQHVTAAKARFDCFRSAFEVDRLLNIERSVAHRLLLVR